MTSSKLWTQILKHKLHIVNRNIKAQVAKCGPKYWNKGYKVWTHILKHSLQSVNTKCAECKVHALVNRQPTICDDSRANNCIFCRHATTKAGQDVPGSLISPFLPISLLHPSPQSPPTPCFCSVPKLNKVTTRWEGPQSLSYHKYSLSKDGLL